MPGDGEKKKRLSDGGDNRKYPELVKVFSKGHPLESYVSYNPHCYIEGSDASKETCLVAWDYSEGKRVYYSLIGDWRYDYSKCTSIDQALKFYITHKEDYESPNSIGKRAGPKDDFDWGAWGDDEDK